MPYSRTAPIGRLCAALLGAALLGGCASMPEGLRGDYPGPATPVRAEPEDIGTAVRWGGRLLEVQPQQERTCFEILSRPLNDVGRPIDKGVGAGHRFLACRRGFVDPAGYSKNADITVVGRLADFETRSIGDYEYRYPVVRFDAAHIWEPRPELDRRPVYPPPWWYDPYWRFRPWYYY